MYMKVHIFTTIPLAPIGALGSKDGFLQIETAEGENFGAIIQSFPRKFVSPLGGWRIIGAASQWEKLEASNKPEGIIDGDDVIIHFRNVHVDFFAQYN
jgi:hypothetical protein